ncbi:hypothetical protein GCM10023090_25970 [Acidovorax lacteus]|uniref:Uncharacterized protein n=1 Tax=Acidovorax lacteus TaxID=1924988 RepID=A0ABP8LG71_9BURK
MWQSVRPLWREPQRGGPAKQAGTRPAPQARPIAVRAPTQIARGMDAQERKMKYTAPTRHRPAHR